MDNPTLPPSEPVNTTTTATTTNGGAVVSHFHPLDETNIFLDLKILLTRPRYFFEFFANPSRINKVVWAKVILIYLGLSALNSMVSPFSAPEWSAQFDGLDPRVSHFLQRFMHQFAMAASQVLSAMLPFFTLVYTAIIASFCILTLRLLGGDQTRMTWSGIFCALIAAQWTTIFGFIPGIGTFIIALLPMLYSVVGLAQISKLSKLRTFFGAYIMPAILIAITLGIVASAIMAMGIALFA